MILIIFDVDGTLVFSEKLDSRCFAATYQEVYRIPFPTIDWRKYPHVSDTTITILLKIEKIHPLNLKKFLLPNRPLIDY